MALSVQPSLARVVQNNNVQVAVQAVIPAVGLGTWSVDLNFGTAATFVSCTPIAGLCTTAKPAPTNSVRITGSGNLSGTQTLVTVTLKGKPPGTLPSTSTLALTANILGSPLSVALSPNITNGTLRVLPALPDANQDGVANAVDTLCVLRRAASMPATAACPNPLPYADINGDGVVNAVDAQCVQRYVAGLPATAPNCLQAIGVGLTGAIVAPPPDDGDDPIPEKSPPPTGTP